MRKLVLILALLIPVAARAQGQWGTLPVDLVMPMNTSTPGTQLTAAIGAAGTVSVNCVPGSAGATGCNFTNDSGGAPSNTGVTIGANQNTCSNLGAVAVNGGATFPAQSLNYNNLAMADSVAFTPPNTWFNFNSSIRPLSMTLTMCVTLGMPGQANGNDYDMIWLQDNSGHGSIAQIGNSCGSTGRLGITIETSSPFGHSGCVTLQPYDGIPAHSTYWISLNQNGSTSTGTLTVYNAEGAFLGQVSATSDSTAIVKVRMPSNENGTDANTTYYQNVMMQWTGTPPLSLFWNQTDTTAGILSPARSADWNLAGVTGGIPTGRTKCVTTNCAALNSSSTASQIQTAFAGAPANSYVLLPSATYPFCLSLSGISNVTLRGGGANNTIFSPTSSCGGAGINVTNTGSTNQGSPATVSGVTVQGSNTLTLSTVSGLSVGSTIIIDQHDSTTDLGGLLILGSPSSYTGPFTAPGNAGPYSQDGETQNARCPGGSSSPATCFHQEHIAVVTGISGSNVTISPPLAMPNWSPSLTMSAWWASTPISGVGVEDLQVNMTGASGGDGIYLTWCANCWTKGVSVVDTNLAHVQMNYSTNDTINNSYFFLTQNHTTSSYGTVCNSCSHALIENNIFHGIASPVIWNGTSSGNVVGYNFNINDYYTSSTGYSQNFIGEHSGGVDTNLYEGNFTTNWAAADTIHGTGNLSTFFRNYISGTPPACYASGSTYATSTYAACNNPLVPFQIQSYHRFYNVIGNVLGTTGQNTTYLANQSFSNSDVYSVGLGGSAANDPNVNATIMLWGNCDSATGFTACRFNANEINAGTAFISLPTSQQIGYNPTPASHTLPASFYYSFRPGWWPSAKPWPIIGPDISGGNVSGVNGLVYTNPAGDCYNTFGGLANGTGPQLTGFNESICYSTAPTGSITITPASQNFGSIVVGSSSVKQKFTIASTLSSSTSLTIANSTGNPSDFPSVSGGTCTSTLAANGSCTYFAEFTPSLVGSESTSLAVTSSAGVITSNLYGVGLTNRGLDKYGALLNVNCSPISGYFHTAKVGNRWFFCDPLGHGFVSMSVGGLVPPANPTLDCAGVNTYPLYIAKYGDATYNWSWQTLNRLQSWGFNSLGQDAGGQLFPENTCTTCTWPGGVQPVPVPYIIEFKPAENASINAFALLSSPLKDAIAGTNLNWTGYRGAALYDAFDPALSTEWAGELARNATFANSVRANDPYVLAILTDDSDYFSGSGAGPDFSTGHTAANTAFTILLTSPVQTYIQSTALGGDKFVYGTQQFFSKSQALNPVTTCSATNPCSLRDYLWQEYGTISALNTAWGSTYTTFDSTGTQITSEAFGTGDGTTKVFTHTLAHPNVDPFSVLISVAGTAQIGDCPWIHNYGGCADTTVNTGTLGSPVANLITQASSAINYSTGVVTITFVTAPASGAAITAKYIYGGWMGGGTGLMDENGANAWVGTNPFCLEGANSSYPTYFSCIGAGGVHNAIPNANANMGADLDAWLQEFSAQYFKTMKTDLRAVSNLPYFGLDILGAYGVPAYSGFLQGAAPYIDGAFTTTLSQTWSSTNAEWLNRFQYMTQYLGDVPFMTFNIFTAQASSSMSCYTAGVLPQIDFPTQTARGQNWLTMFSAELNTVGFSGSFPVVGADWWTFDDFQQLNQGLTTSHDNAYDGVESVVPSVPCDPYYAVLPGAACGGESSTYNAPYGNALGNITAANLLWLNVGTPPSPCFKCLVEERNGSDNHQGR